MQQTLFCVLLLLSSLTVRAEDYEALPYDRLQQKSVHNAYQRKESLSDQLEVYQLRSLELDIFPSKRGQRAPAMDWFVYHSPSDQKSSVNFLSDGLDVLKKFHDEDPNHEVITVFMDIKAPFQSDGHLAEDLDQLLRSSLGSMLWSPSDLMARCPESFTLQNSVQKAACDWPSLQELRGRILFVLTSAPILDYVLNGSKATQRAAFIAPQITSVTAIENFPFAVFFNMEKSVALRGEVLQGLRQRNLIGRTWDVNDARTWKSLASLPIQHIATDKVNTQKDPWSTTLDAEGHVFRMIPLSFTEYESASGYSVL